MKSFAFMSLEGKECCGRLFYGRMRTDVELSFFGLFGLRGKVPLANLFYARMSRDVHGGFLRPGDFLVQNSAILRNAMRMLLRQKA